MLISTGLTILAGPAHSGRTTLLGRIRAAVTARGAHVVDVRLAPGDQDRPMQLAARLAAAVGPLTVRALAARRGLVVLVDDGQWADTASLEVVAPLVRELGPAITVVYAQRLPLIPPGVRELPPVDATWARWVYLRPLTSPQIASVTAELVGAWPEPELVAQLRRASRGAIGVVAAVARARLADGSLRVTHGVAHAAGPLGGPLPDELVRHVRELGPQAFAAGKALAVLHPLADAAPAVLADETGVRRLREAGIVRGMSFRVPAIGDALLARLGPFERRRLSALAVRTLWSQERPGGDPAYLADRLVDAAEMLAGDGGALEPAEVGRAVAALTAAAEGPYPSWRAEHWRATAAGLQPAPQAAPRHGAAPSSDRVVAAYESGGWDRALALGMPALAASSTEDIEAARVRHALAMIHLSRGRTARARALLAAAAGASPVDVALARIEILSGRNPQAVIERALARRDLPPPQAAAMWLLAAESAAGRGDRDGAAAAVTALAGLRTADSGDHVALHHLRARLLVGADTSAAEAIALARTMGQPYLLAQTLIGCGDPARLGEAYSLLGELGAILDRCHVRNRMREHGVAVPDRAGTLAEHDRLLAVMVAEGASNRELATVFQASEKSVEARLTRLFTRTGYRSRVELATAVLSGAYR